MTLSCGHIWLHVSPQPQRRSQVMGDELRAILVIQEALLRVYETRNGPERNQERYERDRNAAESEAEAVIAYQLRRLDLHVNTCS